MFDIGFWELATIAVIGIVVVGPDRLPEVVRTVAVYVRKARRAFHNVKSDIERELELDEIRRQIDEVDMEAHIKKLNQSVMDIDQDVRGTVSHLDRDLRHHLDVNDPEVRAAQEQEARATATQYADTGVEVEREQSALDAVRNPPSAPTDTQKKPHLDD